MKKVLLLSAAACMFSFVHAEDSGTDSSGGHGFYFGGGLLLSDSGEKVDYQEYYDEDGNYAPQAKYTESDSMKINSGATLLFGYQRVLNNCPVFLGVEAGSDFSRTRTERQSDKTGAMGIPRKYNIITTRGGVSPFIDFRVGYINSEYKTMVYIKSGMSHASSKENYYEFDQNGVYMPEYSGAVKLARWMPLVAVGVEKVIAKDLTGRLECEYRFSTGKDKKQGFGDHTKFTQKDTFNIRALAVYNVRLGCN